MKIRQLQFVWWGDFTRWGRWEYPQNWRVHEKLKKPIFYGFYLGPVEIRWFPRQDYWHEHS